MRTSHSRADLLAALLAGDEARIAAAARLCGFDYEPPSAEHCGMHSTVGDAAHQHVAGRSKPEDDPAPARDTPLEVPPPWAPIPFWRVVSREPRQLDAADAKRLAQLDTPSPRDFAATAPLPLAPDLMPWPRLRHRLHRLLAQPRPGRAVDLDWLVARVARRLPIEHVRRRSLRRFPAHLWLLLDRSNHLLPVWSDQDRLVTRLGRLLPPRRLVVHTLLDGPGFPVVEQVLEEVAATRAAKGLATPLPRRYAPPPAGAPLLVLSDLGAYAGVRVAADWAAFLRNQARAGHVASALLPAPRDRHAATLPASRCAVWDRVPRGQAARTPAQRTAAARALLRQIAPLVFVEPGLLRAVRFLLPLTEADVGTEFDAWALVGEQHVAGGTLGAELRAELSAPSGLHAVDAARLRRVLELVATWRAARWRGVALEERLQWRAVLGDEVATSLLGPCDADVAQLLALAKAATAERVGDPQFAGYAAWLKRMSARLAPEVQQHPRLGPAVREALRRGIQPPEPPHTWQIVQRGRQLRFSPDAAARAAGTVVVGELVAQSPFVEVVGGDRIVRTLSLADASLHERAVVQLFTDREVVCVEMFERPSGADAIGVDARGLWLRAGRGAESAVVRWQAAVDRWLTTESGWSDLSPMKAGGPRHLPAHWRPEQVPAWADSVTVDEFGFVAEVAVGEVTLRLRRIPGGRFLMGSPLTEAGRFGTSDRPEWDEQQHDVTVSGFWLAETAVTQQLWQAVMGSNPSRFQSPDRPVERVSWDDCVKFIGKLNQLVPGLALRLPTEAEWEYACRAGTTTATYAGDLTIRGEYHAPELDDIAWYGGNSGLGFELAEGEDSRGWLNKQYPHAKAGTRPVAQKRPNAYGLYDMLGNVWEWCEDWLAPYGDGPKRDPRGAARGVRRVLRGGSWFHHARDVRAANRSGSAPDIRDDDVGVRLAQGQGELAGAEPQPVVAEPRPEVQDPERGRGTRPRRRRPGRKSDS